jgi:hypothetical protein
MKVDNHHPFRDQQDRERRGEYMPGYAINALPLLC